MGLPEKHSKWEKSGKMRKICFINDDDLGQKPIRMGTMLRQKN